jgi:hypothetical protein
MCVCVRVCVFVNINLERRLLSQPPSHAHAQGFFVSQFGAALRERAVADGVEGDEDLAMVGTVLSENSAPDRATPEEETEADINMRWQIGKLLGECNFVCVCVCVCVCV